MNGKITPEQAGISSERVLRFLRNLDGYRMPLHSVIMSKGDEIYAEGYYAPFDEKFLHRMYSASKTFVAMAVGVAVTEGLLSLDDVIVDYLPEYKNPNVDEYYESCTVRDMLKMKSNVGTLVRWWGQFPDRVEAYYSMTTSKLPGTCFYYDSIGSFLLGCIIERLTGKTFLDYLKEKVLLEIGFSKESYTLREPGGFAVGDSGVMCTARDLWLLARFIMKKGAWGGKQYINRAFMEEAVSSQSYNHFDSGLRSQSKSGYGYLIWKTHKDGFSLIGMGDQLAICDEKRDLCLVLTADNQANTAAREVIYNEYYNHFLEKAEDFPLPENEEASAALAAYLASRTLVAQDGDTDSPLAERISGVPYIARENALGVKAFTLTLDKEEGRLSLVFADKTVDFDFAIGKNKCTKFSYGTRARADMMGAYEEGAYDAAVSGAWVEKETFAVMAQVIDTYFGAACAYLSFKGEEATLSLTRSGQYVFEDVEGFVIGKKIQIEKELLKWQTEKK